MQEKQTLGDWGRRDVALQCVAGLLCTNFLSLPVNPFFTFGVFICCVGHSVASFEHSLPFRLWSLHPVCHFVLSSLIFVNVPGQICSADRASVSPAWSQLSVHTVLSFSLTLPRMASQSPLHLPSSFEYRSEMDFQKSKSSPAERAVDLFFLYGEIWKIPLAISFSLWRCLWSSHSSEEEGGFPLVNFLLHLICFPPAYHKGNSSLSLKSVSRPHRGTSTWVFLSYLSPLCSCLTWRCLIPSMRTVVVFPLSY